VIKFRWPISLEREKAMTNSGEGSLHTFESRRGNTYAPLVNYVVFQNQAHWQRLTSFQTLFDCYHRNPIFFSIVNIKARAKSSRRFQVVNRNTGKLEPITTRKEIPAKIYSLLERPNPTQNRMEFLKQWAIFEQVCGNSFVYINSPLGVKPNITNIQALWNVWPTHIQYKLTGKYFSASSVEDIIKGWRFEYGTYKQEFEPQEIFHRNSPNTEVRDGIIFGRAVACSLEKPLTNIELAYESRNVMMLNRGMRVIFTSEKQDASGKIPLIQSEKDIIQTEMKDYGLLDGQKQFFFSSMPVKAIPVDQDVRKLGLFEEIATDGRVCCNGFGVPEILLQIDIRGATFENQSASVLRLYQDTIIPEAEDEDISLNTMLGLHDTDWCLRSCFDHIPALQEAEQKKYSAYKDISTYMKELFLTGGVTHNQWLSMMDLPTYPEGDRRIWEFTPEQLDIIFRKSVESQSEGQQNGTKTKLNGHSLLVN
jgi:hypothetical protein